MRFKDIKISESLVGSASLKSVPGYIDYINQILSSSNPTLETGDQGQFSFLATPGQKISTLDDAIAGQGQNHRGKEVDQIQAKQIYKSPQMQSQSKGLSSDTIEFNAGEVAEGVHATAAFVRLCKRPSEEIQVADLYPVVKQLENGKTYVAKPHEISSDIADEFHVTVSLKPKQWTAFKQLDKIVNYDKIKGIILNIIEDANLESGRYADLYAGNGKFDLVRVIGDGVSGETETKTDINFENETSRKFKGYSIKAGSTRQIHQVGGGKGTLTPDERFDILNNDLFGVHGKARLIDINNARAKFLKLWESGQQQEAYRAAYQEAVDKFNDILQTDKQEEEFVKNLIVALKYWMRRDEEGVVLKQFTGTKDGTYILDAEKLHELESQDKLNLVAQMATTADPTIRVGDPETKKVLFEIRLKTEKKRDGSLYFRNLINKGKLFVTLTDIAKTT